MLAAVRRLSSAVPGQAVYGGGRSIAGVFEGTLVFERRRMLAAAVGVTALMACAGPCVADSLNDALGSAYEDNADLNAARAELRGVDENVPQALSGYRPTIRGDADAAVEADRVGGPTLGAARSNTIYPRGVSLTVDQPLFLGFRTTNSVKQAKNAVRAARAQLRNVEQQTLLAAVKAFMNVVLAQVVLNLRAQNIVFLREQLRAANDRLEAREGTPTDVAQANGALQRRDRGLCGRLRGRDERARHLRAGDRAPADDPWRRGSRRAVLPEDATGSHRPGSRQPSEHRGGAVQHRRRLLQREGPGGCQAAEPWPAGNTVAP